ncbi:hypothetical protein FKP32DRAFT_1660972 [Trametes sanguinea]|nr:hypothetical protein FKP32DRAFT_1660972 [Trametes sanguinea]
MFFCRHHLLRAPVQRHFAALAISRNSSRLAALSASHIRPRHAGLSRTTSSLPPRSSGDPSSQDTQSTSQPEDEHGLSTDTSEPPPQSSSSQLPASSGVAGAEAEQQDSPEPLTEPPATESPTSTTSETESTKEHPPARDPLPDDPIEAYLIVRSRGEPALIAYGSERYIKAIWRAVHEKRSDVLFSLVEDAIHITDVRDGKTRGRIVIEVLFQTLSVTPTLRMEHVLSLLRCLQRNGQARYLRTSIRTTLAWWLSRLPPDERDGEILDILVPLLLEKMGPLTNTSVIKAPWASSSLESTDEGTGVPRVLWPLFQIAVRLVLLGRRTQASELLAHLVNRQCIHPEAITATDLSSLDLLYVVLSVSVRTCMRFGWFTRASSLLNSAVHHQEKISPPMGQLIEDWLTMALDRPRDQDLKMAASMMILIFQRATEDYVLSSQCLLDFYDTAIEKEPELVQVVYGHSREVQHHSYPPPRDTTLVRMTEFFDSKSHNVHLARVLATQVMDEHISLLPQVRPRFIMHVARLGFSTQARALWERFATGEDGIYIYGHAPLMLRMVSLFMRNAKYMRWRLTKKQHAGKRVDRDGENLERWLSDDQKDSYTTTSQPKRRTGAEDDPQPPDMLYSTPPPHARPSSATSRVDYRPETPPYGFPDLSEQELLEREEDYRRFAGRVFDAFYEAMLPLETAEHYNINAIVRGSLIVERGTMPMDVLLFMKQRKLKMDMRDVNVALSAIAKYNARKGAEYIERLVEHGLQPDAVSFGTVIHWAARRRQGALVQSLIRRAAELGCKTLDYKTLSSLLHTAVRGGLLEDDSPDAVLEFAEQTLDSMLEQRVIPTPRVAHNALIAALRAEQPLKAYQFWQRYMKNSVEWTDPQQERIRSVLKQKIEEHQRVGWLNARKAHVMLLDLNDPDLSFSGPRFGGPKSQRTTDAQRKG